MGSIRSSRIAAFPKCFMDELCVTRTMSLFQWIDMAATLGVDGLEMYPGFFASFEDDYLVQVRTALQHHHLLMPMLCASPDFTQPSPEAPTTRQVVASPRLAEETAALQQASLRRWPEGLPTARPVGPPPWVEGA